MNDKKNKVGSKMQGLGHILTLVIIIPVVLYSIIIGTLILLLGPGMGLCVGIIISSVITAIVVTVILIIKKRGYPIS